MGTRRQVVIVGGGFGGLACARALDGKDADVLLIDRRNYHLFTPLLYQVATSLLNPSDIAYPLRAVFRRSRNVRFREAIVTGVDLEAKTVTVDEDTIRYDTLVLATGSLNNYFGNLDLAHSTVALKTLGEALRLRNRLLSCLEMAEAAPSDAEALPWLTTVVVGGGATGVEYAGALSELLDLTLGHDYPTRERSLARIVLIEGRDRLLPPFHPQLGEYAQRRLEDLGVEVRTETLVKAADDEGVTLSTGETIAAHTVVWSAGVRPEDPLGATAQRTHSRRVDVDDHLRLPDHPDVYVIGDAAAAEHDDGTEIAMLCAPAMQEGRYVARDIVAGGDAGPFRYLDKGTMAVIGRNAAVVQIRGIRARGFLGWVMWLGLHIYYLIGFRNRLVVLSSWAWNYLRRDRPIRMIVRSAPDPLVARFEEAGEPHREPAA